tara:strand:- start:331 stop:489 length:159 start_codon:yes stop_codon:yes gene_type:complete
MLVIANKSTQSNPSAILKGRFSKKISIVNNACAKPMYIIGTSIFNNIDFWEF